jgi:hypothetical protein
MNIVFENIKDVNVENVVFLEKKKNIIMDGNFTKIIYTDTCVTINGLYINFPIQYTSYYSNSIYILNTLNNLKIIKTLVEIEYNLLKYYKQFYNVYKNVIYNINNQLVNGKIKLYREEIPSHKTKIILKISGIWENVNEIGITYKFLEMYESNNCQTISI